MKYVIQESWDQKTWNDVTEGLNLSELINHLADGEDFDSDKYYRVITREIVEKVL